MTAPRTARTGPVSRDPAPVALLEPPILALVDCGQGAPVTVVDVTERLMAEFEDRLGLTQITEVVRGLPAGP